MKSKHNEILSNPKRAAQETRLDDAVAIDQPGRKQSSASKMFAELTIDRPS